MNGRPSLQAALREATRASFNRISVAEHMDPRDTVLVLASGLAGNRGIARTGGRDHAAFVGALTDPCRDLCARGAEDADRIGRAIVNGPLVKTALHGGDSNWAAS
jgi:glutamate N-acetyltransferase/amino-acid N-acetyltransferase